MPPAYHKHTWEICKSLCGSLGFFFIRVSQRLNPSILVVVSHIGQNLEGMELSTNCEIVNLKLL